jgi:hypothetical protein
MAGGSCDTHRAALRAAPQPRQRAVATTLIAGSFFLTLTCGYPCPSGPASTDRPRHQRQPAAAAFLCAVAPSDMSAVAKVSRLGAARALSLHQQRRVCSLGTRMPLGWRTPGLIMRGGGGDREGAFGASGREGLPSIDTPRQIKTPSQSGSVYKAKQSLGQVSCVCVCVRACVCVCVCVRV